MSDRTIVTKNLEDKDVSEKWHASLQISTLPLEEGWLPPQLTVGELEQVVELAKTTPLEQYQNCDDGMHILAFGTEERGIFGAFFRTEDKVGGGGELIPGKFNVEFAILPSAKRIIAELMKVIGK